MANLAFPNDRNSKLVNGGEFTWEFPMKSHRRFFVSFTVQSYVSSKSRPVASSPSRRRSTRPPRRSALRGIGWVMATLIRLVLAILDFVR